MCSQYLKVQKAPLYVNALVLLKTVNIYSMKTLTKYTLWLPDDNKAKQALESLHRLITFSVI